MTIYTITQEQLDAHRQMWRRSGVTVPGNYTLNKFSGRYEPVQEPAECSHDFSHSGLGIGGAGGHDLDAETAELVARGEMAPREYQRTGPMPHGQLWEECSRRGCDNEPVCVDCLYCEEHCRC